MLAAAWSLARSLLRRVLEVTHELRHIVLVLLAGLAFRDASHVLHDVLKERVLLGADLLEDLGHHVLDLLGLRVAGDH